MNTKLYLLIFAGFILCFFSLQSCKKSSTSNNSVNPSTHLLKKVHMDDGGQYLTDEMYTYNANNLVSSRIDSTAGIQSSTLQYYEVWDSFFFYNSTDEKPVSDSVIHKYYESSTGTVTTYTTISNYYYDSQNRLTKTESFVLGTLVYRKLYTYSSGQRVENFYLNNSSGTSDLFYNVTLSINSQNQVNQIISDVTGVTQFTGKDEFAFDTNKNPYNDLNIIKYGTRGTDSAYSFEHVVGPNNMSYDSSYFKDATTPYYISTVKANTYVYNSNGYPTSCARLRTDYASNGQSLGTYPINITYEYY